MPPALGEVGPKQRTPLSSRGDPQGESAENLLLGDVPADLLREPQGEEVQSERTGKILRETVADVVGG